MAGAAPWRPSAGLRPGFFQDKLNLLLRCGDADLRSTLRPFGPMRLDYELAARKSDAKLTGCIGSNRYFRRWCRAGRDRNHGARCRSTMLPPHATPVEN